MTNASVTSFINNFAGIYAKLSDIETMSEDEMTVHLIDVWT